MAISKFNYNSFNVTPVAGAALTFDADADGFSTGSSTALTHIKTLSGTNTSTISFVHGTSDVVLDNTYPVYVFKFFNMHPETADRQFMFQGSIDTGSNYNVSMTTTNFYSYYAGGANYFEYTSSEDQANGTGFQRISTTVRNDNDSACSGELWLYGISSTTFVKNFISKVHAYNQDNAAATAYVAGYFNTTSALDAFQFKQRTGNITGSIKLYGIKDS